MTDGEHCDFPDDAKAGALTMSSFDSRAASVGAETGDLIGRTSAFSQITALSPRTRRRSDLVPAALIDKSALFRAGLRHILSGSRFRITADCNKLSDLPLNALGDNRSVALIGLDRDTQTILPRIRPLKQRYKDLRVVVLSDRLDREQLVAALESGADGFLLRDEIEPDTILKSLELVLADGVVVPQGFAKLLCCALQMDIVAPAPVAESRWHEDQAGPSQADCSQPDRGQPSRTPETAPDPDLARLSERERLILLHLTEGASNKHIARELNIAEATVKAHVKSLLRKIRVNNRTQAAMWAINHVRPQARPALPG